MLSSIRTWKLAPWALVFASAVVAVIAYLQALHAPFISDDVYFLSENPKLLGLHLDQLWRLLVEPYNPASEFLPLRELSFWFDISLFGLNPSEFRVHNILLYLLCLPLVYAVTLNLWRYFRPTDVDGAPWAAAVVTALFALNPALVESVVWVSGRKYVLANLFAMLALWFAIRAKREHGLSLLQAAAALLAFVAMMLAKTSYIAVAPIVAVLWVMFWRDIPAPRRRYSLLLWPLAILILAAALILVFIASSQGREPFYFGIEVVERTLAVLGWLARLAVTPESRHFFYPVFEDTSFPVMIVCGVVVLAAATAGMVMILRKRSLEGFALVAFLLLCFPYMQLMPYAAPSLVQDRYLSLAAWPVVVLIVAWSWRLSLRPRMALLLVIALSWGYQTVERPRDWRNFDTLVDADLRTYPGYYMPASFKIVGVQLADGLTREANETASKITDPELRDVMLGMIRIYQAVHIDAVATGNPQQAMALLRQLFLDLQHKPDQAKWNSPINRFWEKRRNVLANEWRFLASSFPDDEMVRYNVALWMLDEQRYRNAIVYLRATIESQRLPESVRGTAFKSLGIALLNSGHAAEAEGPLRAALEQSPPDLQAYCPLADVYKQTARIEEAARAQAGCRSSVQSQGSAQ